MKRRPFRRWAGRRFQVSASGIDRLGRFPAVFVGFEAGVALEALVGPAHGVDIVEAADDVGRTEGLARLDGSAVDFLSRHCLWIG